MIAKHQIFEDCLNALIDVKTLIHSFPIILRNIDIHLIKQSLTITSMKFCVVSNTLQFKFVVSELSIHQSRVMIDQRIKLQTFQDNR